MDNTKNTRYNGWANYETWVCRLWLDNVPEDYKLIREKAQEAKSTGKDAQINLMHFIKDFIEANVPDLGASLYSDLLNAGLRSIDYYEIAGSYLDDLD